MITLHLPVIRRNQPTEQKYIGRHRPDTIQPAAPTYLLTPAAYQTHTRTTEQVTADVDQPTGFLDPRDVISTNQWTVPAPDGARTAVLAEMRADLNQPDGDEQDGEEQPDDESGEDPALTAVDRIFTTVMEGEQQ